MVWMVWLVWLIGLVGLIGFNGFTGLTGLITTFEFRLRLEQENFCASFDPTPSSFNLVSKQHDYETDICFL